MAYVTPGTVAAGDVATAAAWNVITNDILQFAPFVQGVFTNEAARDAAITAPTEGMHAYLTAPTVPAATGSITAISTGAQTIYNGTNWVCVTPVGATSNINGNTTSTSYVTTLTGDSTALSVTLVTGSIAMISMSARPYSGATGNCFLSFSVSGATTVAASDSNAAQTSIVSNGTYGQLSRTQIITGLTAGTNTFTLNYKTSSPQIEYNLRSLVVSGIA
jgi:hypothetical protein